LLNNRNFPFVKHYEEKYCGHFPIWVTAELMTFSNLFQLYKIMKVNDRDRIASYFATEQYILKTWIAALVEEGWEKLLS